MKVRIDQVRKGDFRIHQLASSPAAYEELLPWKWNGRGAILLSCNEYLLLMKMNWGLCSFAGNVDSRGEACISHSGAATVSSLCCASARVMARRQLKGCCCSHRTVCKQA